MRQIIILGIILCLMLTLVLALPPPPPVPYGNTTGTTPPPPTTGAAAINTSYIPQTDTCRDGLKNGAESDVDCGGSCGVCAPDKICTRNSDCSTGFCNSQYRCGFQNLQPLQSSTVPQNLSADTARQDCPIVECPAAVQPTYNFSWLYALLIINMAITLLLLIYLAVKNASSPKPHQEPQDQEEHQLKDYVQQCLSRGYQKEQIHETLKNTGWPEEEIMKVL